MKKILILLIISVFVLAGCTQDGVESNNSNLNLSNNDELNSGVSESGSLDVNDDLNSDSDIGSDPSSDIGLNSDISSNSAKSGSGKIENSTVEKLDDLDNEGITNELGTPVVKFNKKEIEELGLDCSGSNAEIAECIYNWQLKNMIYIPTTTINYEFPKSYPIRWNWFLPGIYNSKDILELDRYENKWYGVCFEYSVMYCSIAEYYDVPCRITVSKSKISDGKGDYELATKTGMGEDEYNELKIFLDKYKLDYDYEAVRLVAEETPAHYWAEVKLNGKWMNFDATGADKRVLTKKNFIDLNDFEVLNWSTRDKREKLDKYMDMIANGESLAVNTGNNSDFEEFTQGRTISEAEGADYEGVTDELGNLHRAETIDDFMQGKALAPYMASCEDSCDFVKADAKCKSGCDKLDEEPAQCYNDCAGEKFFIVCDYICEDASDSEYPSCYEACSGNKLNLQCDSSCWND